jgi:DNA-binding CsgD family transcriptional regulator
MTKAPHVYPSIYNSIEKVEQYWRQFKPNTTLEQSYQEKWLSLSGFFELVAVQMRVCITLWDATSNRFIFAIDPTAVLGDNAAYFTKEDGVDYTIAKFNPDHLHAFLLMQEYGIKYCIQNNKLLPFKILMNQDSRYRKDDEYIHILQQVTVVEVDTNGHPLFFLSYVHDISHLKKESSASLVIKSPHETLMLNYVFSKKLLKRVRLFTGKEHEMLQLLSKGKQSKEIAQELKLSPHTVNTYRRNLLSKTCCVDTTALVSYCQMVGLI